MKTHLPTVSVFLGLWLLSAFFPAAPDVYGQRTWTLNEKEYLHCNDFSVLFFHNIYPVGKQGGIEFIHHDRRIATNGNLHCILRQKEEEAGEQFQAEPVPRLEIPSRICDFPGNSVSVEHSSGQIGYTITIRPDGEGFRIECAIADSNSTDQLAALFFELELYPEIYKGKSYHSEGGEGLFPWYFSGESSGRNGEQLPLPLVSGEEISIAPEDQAAGFRVRSENSTMDLLDGRSRSERNWFLLRAYASPGVSSFSLYILPGTVEGWQKPPVIGYSQAGYHPSQPKRAVIEADPGHVFEQEAELVRIEPDGRMPVILRKRLQPWGEFLRYIYAVFDFSEIREPGIYKIRYGDQSTGVFTVSRGVFSSGTWQQSLEVFIPVQMCHVRVMDRGRVWHGACHLDDALQAPTPLEWFDGFDQSELTQIPFAPKTTIPGMNRGGWHDAGDDDINTGSTGRTIYHLALATEEFGQEWDQTTVNFREGQVILHQPDGVSDAIQQIIHGLHWIIPQYRHIGHSIVGVISNSWETYLQTGDWGLFTDNLFHKSDYPADSSDGQFSGTFDDRYAFTNKDSRREYFVAAMLAASSRVLNCCEPGLASECLDIAREIWKTEEAGEPVFFRSVGTPPDIVKERTNAAVELYLATSDRIYLRAILDRQTEVLGNIRNTGWTLSRVVETINNRSFRKNYETRLHEYSGELKKELGSNPFGVHYSRQIWGIGWNILWNMFEHYYLIKNYPVIFPKEDLFNAVHFVLGMHPGSDLSFVSGIGSHRPIPAFGITRSDYAMIPGGVYSGTAMILPDFPELKADHPFLWQQSEYIIFGASAYIFCILAAESMLND